MLNKQSITKTLSAIHEAKQTVGFVQAMEIILRHEDPKELQELIDYCKHRIKKLREENETQAFM